MARPLFYVGRATYVVAWRLRPGGGAVAQVIEEVDTIQAAAPRAAVVLVATEAEMVSHQEALDQVEEVQEAVSKRLIEIKHSEATCIKVYDGGVSIIVKREGERVGGSGEGANAVVESGVLGVGAVAEAVVATAQSSPFYREAVPGNPRCPRGMSPFSFLLYFSEAVAGHSRNPIKECALASLGRLDRWWSRPSLHFSHMSGLLQRNGSCLPASASISHQMDVPAWTRLSGLESARKRESAKSSEERR